MGGTNMSANPAVANRKKWRTNLLPAFADAALKVLLLSAPEPICI
jgi:hypothetical protein